MKEIDNSSKKSLLRFYEYGIYLGNTEENKVALSRINTSINGGVKYRTIPLN